MKQQRLPESAQSSLHSFAVELAESVGGFEYVRDVHALGATIGIETDIAAGELVSAAARHGIAIEPSGDTSIRLQLPLVLSDEDRNRLLTGLGESMESMERQTAEINA